MNREIKFIAWDKRQNKFLWPYPEGFSILGEVTAFGLIERQLIESGVREDILEYILNDIMLLQFTGLKDKNGKEIYEGFIVKWEWAGENKKEIVFSDGSFHPKGWHHDKSFEYEIIGNIYTNPELL